VTAAAAWFLLLRFTKTDFPLVTVGQRPRLLSCIYTYVCVCTRVYTKRFSVVVVQCGRTPVWRAKRPRGYVCACACVCACMRAPVATVRAPNVVVCACAFCTMAENRFAATSRWRAYRTAYTDDDIIRSSVASTRSTAHARCSFLALRSVLFLFFFFFIHSRSFSAR